MVVVAGDVGIGGVEPFLLVAFGLGLPFAAV